MMKNNKILANTSPYGNWNYGNLVGGTAKITSKAVGTGSWGVPTDEVFLIKDVKIKIETQTGRGVTVVTLEGLNGKEFYLKDLQILSVTKICPAICGNSTCGKVICGKK